MSRAFVKEDIDVPERSTRRRSASGLPPGAVNYMTAAGAQRLTELKNDSADEEEILELGDLLDSATVIQVPEHPDAVVFGTRVTVRSEHGEVKSWRIVGVDEVSLEPDQVSWVSPMGKALLGARIGQRLSLDAPKAARWTVIGIE